MKYLALISTLFMLITSCEKSNDTNEINQKTGTARPEIPDNDSIDINSDNVADFVVLYYELATMDEPSSAGSIIGSIFPLNENQLLYRRSVGFLFLGRNDTIRKDSNTNSIWNNYGADIVTISRHNYSNWDTNWTVLSKHSIDYFLACKINYENIGWLLLNIDKENGVVTILDKEFTDSKELIIKD